MKMLTPRTFFEDIVPTVMKTRAAQAALPAVGITFLIAGDSAWTIRMSAGEGRVIEEDDSSSELRFIASREAFEDILCGNLDAKRALETAAMTIEGDWSLLPQLAFLFMPPGRAWHRSSRRSEP
jgi:SCP-2 sterol transfer family protein